MRQPGGGEVFDEPHVAAGDHDVAPAVIVVHAAAGRRHVVGQAADVERTVEPFDPEPGDLRLPAGEPPIRDVPGRRLGVGGLTAEGRGGLR